MTLANKITVLRIIAIPFFVIALLYHYILSAQILFVVSVFSDALDGTIARVRGERTPLGTFLDPMADKLLLLSAYITLTYLGEFPLWVFVAVLSRDVLILMGWTLVYVLTSNRKIEPRPLGKVTTFLQMILVVGVLFHFTPVYYQALLHLTIAATLISAIDYVWMGNQRLGMLEP
jgi:cardiolipin synthase